MSVLLVEDDTAIREMFVEVLSEEGYSVMAAYDGQDALSYLATACPMPRLILLDLQMPVMNGWQFMQAIQDKKDITEIPIVIMSATSDLQMVVSGLAIAEVLKKPVMLEQLFAVVERYCSGGPRSA